jgi:acetoin utilization deacetylase AcuC-like enzyme
MNHTGIVWSDVFLQHDTGPHHPERAERLQSIHDRLASTGLLTRCRVIAPEPVDLSLVERVHAGEYIGRFQEACEQGRHSIDTSDCAICPISFDAARLAAGAVVAAVDQVMAGRCANVFCPVRPPGHHAEYRAAMGFCFFNNIAIGPSICASGTASNGWSSSTGMSTTAMERSIIRGRPRPVVILACISTPTPFSPELDSPRKQGLAMASTQR